MEEARGRMVPADQAFWIEGACQLRSLGELMVALSLMPDDMFDSYVREGKNDFADWVENCLQEEGLVADLRANPTLLSMRGTLRAYLAA